MSTLLTITSPYQSSLLKLGFIHFYETQNLTLKLLYEGSFTFWTAAKISDMEKAFAKNPSFLSDK